MAWRPPWGFLVPAALLAALTAGMPLLAPLFHALFPALDRPVYARAGFPALLAAHAGLVALSGLAVVAIGLAAGIFVTRPAGRDFAGLLATVTAIGQTFPPVAVLALAVPMVGYGGVPAFIALVAYGILPVVENTVAGLRQVPPAAVEAARGMGFTPRQRLLRVELPLAAPVILAGVRTVVIVSIGTATIGSTVGALTLGSPIIEGLSGSNTAYVIQGAAVVALFAVTADQAFAWLDRRLAARRPG